MIKTVKAPHILLPKEDIDWSKYAVIACDQYTSNVEYWNTLREEIGDNLSTLNMIYPEAYLERTENDAYINNINKNISTYLKNKELVDIGRCFILVERLTSYGVKRLGLVLAIDLEDYSYEKGTKALIRASEATIVERIPPRLAIRKDAKIELPHVLVLFDDPQKHIVEPLYSKRDKLEKVYDFELNKDGGHIRGYKVNDTKEVIKQFNDLFCRNNNKLLFIVGDGNHSLATAKAHWEIIKKNLSEKQKQNHPARYALVEANNLYDDGIIFEPIHRVMFNVDDNFESELRKHVDGEFISFTYTKNGGKKELKLPRNAPMAYLEVQTFLDEYLVKHPEAKIDFIHDEDELMSVADKNTNSVAIVMPTLTKEDLFDYLAKGRVLPRKSFSMGHANEKRYYLEAKKIK